MKFVNIRIHFSKPYPVKCCWNVLVGCNFYHNFQWQCWYNDIVLLYLVYFPYLPMKCKLVHPTNQAPHCAIRVLPTPGKPWRTGRLKWPISFKNFLYSVIAYMLLQAKMAGPKLLSKMVDDVVRNSLSICISGGVLILCCNSMSAPFWSGQT